MKQTKIYSVLIFIVLLTMLIGLWFLYDNPLLGQILVTELIVIFTYIIIKEVWQN